MAPGAVYVMMFIWAGIYFGIGALFSYWGLEYIIVELIVNATHHIATGPELVADPNYNVTIEEIRALSFERYGEEVPLEWTDYYVPFYANSLDYMSDEGITIHGVAGHIINNIGRHADTVWGSFCGIGCFIGLMNIFRARKANGDHGIAEFDI